MIVPAKSNTIEIEVKKSRFIATAFYCDSFETLKSVVAQTRKDNPGANHVVHAAVIGTQFSLSDDHEPKNTAGRPAFEVLKGSHISNIGITITRYFGGTLLGTGGLVKAYGDSAKAVLASLETREFVIRIPFSVTVPYELLQTAQRTLREHEAAEVHEEFTDCVHITGQIPQCLQSQLSMAFSELSNGKIQVRWC